VLRKAAFELTTQQGFQRAPRGIRPTIKTTAIVVGKPLNGGNRRGVADPEEIVPLVQIRSSHR